jgi:AbrB family looped-hinge helix DNA binding protein
MTVYELYAVKYAERDGRRGEHFYGGDPHDAPMPMDYFVWAAVSPERTVVVDCGFSRGALLRQHRGGSPFPHREQPAADVRRLRDGAYPGRLAGPHHSRSRPPGPGALPSGAGAGGHRCTAGLTPGSVIRLARSDTMNYKVGPKGQVVIPKEIREQLGVQSGWGAVQEVMDDHVEIYFLPPEHHRSLLGVLRPYLQRSLPTDPTTIRSSVCTNTRTSPEAAGSTLARHQARWTSASACGPGGIDRLSGEGPAYSASSPSGLT